MCFLFVQATGVGALEPVSWLYIQMELCNTSLRQLLSATGKDAWLVNTDRILEIRRYFRDVAEGLSYIHSKHYIHRDMKPDNIFIVDNHGTIVAKLGDFGLSCKTNPEKADGCGVEILTPRIREGGAGDKSMISFSGSLSDEDMDAASRAELTRACGTRMYFSPELEHSGVYNQLVDVYALGIVLFEMLHVFKTGMERIKVIEQLKQAMCSQPGIQFSQMPLSYILVHLGASKAENGVSTHSPQTGSKPSTPSSEKSTPKPKRRPFEQADDSGGESDIASTSHPSSPVGNAASRHGMQSADATGAATSRHKKLSVDCSSGGGGSPGPDSPVASRGEESKAKARREKLRALIACMSLPMEVIELLERFEFEVCLLLRLLSKAPGQRPSARDVCDELFKVLEKDKNMQQHDAPELEKLRRQVALLQRQIPGNTANMESSSPGSAARRSVFKSQSEADLKSHGGDGM